MSTDPAIQAAVSLAMRGVLNLSVDEVAQVIRECYKDWQPGPSASAEAIAYDERYRAALASIAVRHRNGKQL